MTKILTLLTLIIILPFLIIGASNLALRSSLVVQPKAQTDKNITQTDVNPEIDQEIKIEASPALDANETQNLDQEYKSYSPDKSLYKKDCLPQLDNQGNFGDCYLYDSKLDKRLLKLRSCVSTDRNSCTTIFEFGKKIGLTQYIIETLADDVSTSVFISGYNSKQNTNILVGKYSRSVISPLKQCQGADLQEDNLPKTCFENQQLYNDYKNILSENKKFDKAMQKYSLRNW